MVLQVADLLAQQILGSVAEQVSNSRTYKRVTLVAIDHQNQVWKALQKTAPKLFLFADLPLHLSFFGDINQCALITNDVSRAIPNGARGVHANRRASILTAEAKFPHAG